MTYALNFSFSAAASSTITVLLKNNDGTTFGVPTISATVVDGIWYGLTLQIPKGFQGYASFSDGASTVAQFGINPSEFETLPLEGSGGSAYTATIRDNQGNTIESVAVWVTTDQEGKIVVGGTLYTNSDGQVTFNLNAGNYYLWRKSPNYTFENPALITVS